MPTERKSRPRLKALLACIAVVLLGMQALTLTNQQGSNQVISVAAPTQVTEPAAPDIADAACAVTVRAQVLNQRSGPGTSYSITGGARHGEVFTVYAENGTGQWFLVSTSSGSAWMYARYVTPNGDCDNLPVYNSPNGPNEPEAQAASPSPTSAPERTAQPTNASSGLEAAGTLSTAFTAEVLYWAPEITAWADTYQLDANLIATVIQIESCGNPSARSSAGAQGLFQVMPFHFAAGEDMLDIETNARRGLEYLQGALKLAQGNVSLALAGYNGGYGVINGRWAAETQRYSYWGSGIYSEAVSGMASSATLQEWLAAGGASLCASASRYQSSDG